MKKKPGVSVHNLLRIAAFVLFSALIFQQPVYAASTACDAIEAYPTVTASDWVVGMGSELQAGDYITISVTPDAGTPTLATLQAPVGTDVATSGVPGTLTYAVTGPGITAIRVFVTGGSAVIDWGCGDAPAPAPSPSPADEDTSTVVEPPQCTNLLDGRINDIVGRDCAAPIAIYNVNDGFAVYAIDPATSAGTFALGVSATQIEAARQDTETHQLLAQGSNPATGQPIRLYLLDTGEYQITTAYADDKPYIFVWDDSGNNYHLAD